MGGVSPVLYPILCARRNFHHFLWKIKNSISASKCPITALKIRTRSLLLSKFSYWTHRLLNGGRPRLWARLPRSGYNPVGGGVGEGGGFSLRQPILITLPQAVRQMRGVGRGEVGGGGGERGGMKQITAHSNPYSSFSLSFCPLCIRRGFDKNFARGRAEHFHSALSECFYFLSWRFIIALLFSFKALLSIFLSASKCLFFYSECKSALIFYSSKYETVSNFVFKNIIQLLL